MTGNQGDADTLCAAVTIESRIESCPLLPENGQTAAGDEPLETGIQEECPFSEDASGVVDVKALALISPTGVVRDEEMDDKGCATKDVPCAEPDHGQEITAVEQTIRVELSDGAGLASAKGAKTRRRGLWNPLRWLCGANKGKKTKRPVKHIQVRWMKPSAGVDQYVSCPVVGRGTDRIGTRPHVGIEDHCSVEFSCGTPQTEDKPHSEQDQDQDQNVSYPASDGGPETTQTWQGENLTVSDGDAAVKQSATASSIAEDDCIEKMPVLLQQEPVSELPPMNVVEEQEMQDESCAALLGDGFGAVEHPILASETEPTRDGIDLASTVKEQKIRHRSWWNPFSWLCPGKKSKIAQVKPTLETVKPVVPASSIPVEVGINVMSEQTEITLVQDRAVTRYRNETCPVAHADGGTTKDLAGMTTDQTASPTLSCAEDVDGEKLMQKPAEGDETCAP